MIAAILAVAAFLAACGGVQTPAPAVESVDSPSTPPPSVEESNCISSIGLDNFDAFWKQAKDVLDDVSIGPELIRVSRKAETLFGHLNAALIGGGDMRAPELAEEAKNAVLVARAAMLEDEFQVAIDAWLQADRARDELAAWREDISVC